jgi:hypothetical protein
MRNQLIQVHQAFNQMFPSNKELVEQYHAIKRDIMALVSDAQSFQADIEMVCTPSGFTVYHSLEGKRVRQIFTPAALSQNDLNEMRALRLAIGTEIKTLREVA